MRRTCASEGDYESMQRTVAESIYPVIEGYKDSVAFGGHARFSDPIGFDGLNLTLSYSPDSDLASKERRTRRCDFRHFAGLRASNGTPAISTTCSARPSAVARVTAGSSDYEHPLDFRSAGNADRRRRGSPTSATWTHCQDFQNVPSPTNKLGEAKLGLVYKYPRASVGSVDDETGYLWSVLAHALRSARARSRRRSSASSTSAGPCRSAFFDLAAHRRLASHRATATTRWRTPISAASATTTSTTATPSVIATC